MNKGEEKMYKQVLINDISVKNDNIYDLIDLIRLEMSSIMSVSKLVKINNLLVKFLISVEIQQIKHENDDLIIFFVSLLKNCSNNFDEEILNDMNYSSVFLQVVEKIFAVFNGVYNKIDLYLKNMDFIAYFLDYLPKDIYFSCKFELYNFFCTLCFENREFCDEVFDSHIFVFLSNHYAVKDVYVPFLPGKRFVRDSLNAEQIEKIELLILNNINNVKIDCAFNMLCVILNIADTCQRVYPLRLFDNSLFYRNDLIFVDYKYGCLFLDYILVFDPIPNVLNDVLKLYQRFPYIDLVKEKIMNYVLQVKEYTRLFKDNQLVYRFLNCDDFPANDKLFTVKLSSQIIKYGDKELDMLYIGMLIELEDDTFIFEQLLHTYLEFKRLNRLTNEFTSIFMLSEKLYPYIQQHNAV